MTIQKVKNRPKLTEADVIRAIKDYLQIQKNQGKLMYIRNNTGAIPIEAGKNKRRFIRFGDKGSPDFLVWQKDYYIDRPGSYIRCIALEAKSDTGTQLPDQIKWQADFVKIGGEYYIVRCPEYLINIIEGR